MNISMFANSVDMLETYVNNDILTRYAAFFNAPKQTWELSVLSICFFMFKLFLYTVKVYTLCFIQLILPAAITQLHHMDINPKSLQFHFILCHVKWRNKPNRDVNIPLIVVWFVVPDFWSDIIWGANICMSVSL